MTSCDGCTKTGHFSQGAVERGQPLSEGFTGFASVDAYGVHEGVYLGSVGPGRRLARELGG